MCPSLPPATPEYTVDSSSGTSWLIKEGNTTVASFHVKVLPFCCAVEEIGMMWWRDDNIPLDLARECITRFLTSRSEGYKAGVTLIHFAPWTNSRWKELFKEAGFKQVLPEFKNHVHPGTMITQLVYVHTREKK